MKAWAGAAQFTFSAYSTCTLEVTLNHSLTTIPNTSGIFVVFAFYFNAFAETSKTCIITNFSLVSARTAKSNIAIRNSDTVIILYFLNGSYLRWANQERNR